MITAQIEVEINVEELKTIYRATCNKSGRTQLGLDDILSRREFIQRVLAGRGTAIQGSEERIGPVHETLRRTGISLVRHLLSLGDRHGQVSGVVPEAMRPRFMLSISPITY